MKNKNETMKKIYNGLIMTLLLSFSVNGQLSILHNFSSSDGNLDFSYKGMLISFGDYLYGMTPKGGVYNFGTIYKVKSDGTNFQKLFDFNGTNGQYPQDGLITDGTYLYGTTKEGGNNDFGTVFKIKMDGTSFLKLKDFDYFDNNGTRPFGALLLEGIYLYGMTEEGGLSGNGAIFKLKTDGTGYQRIFSCASTNISFPKGSLIFDGTFLYGMATRGGNNDKGAIFKIKPDGTSFQILLHFDVANGQVPVSSLLLINDNLYGMCSGGTFETGLIFKIKTDGTNYLKLYEYNASSSPAYGGNLIYDGTSLYGLTSSKVFRIELDGSNFTHIHNFSSPSLFSPAGSMIYDGTNFYGIANAGGANNQGGVFSFKECETILPVIINNGGTLSTNQTYSSYQWYFNGTLISGATQSSYTPTQSGNYSVIIASASGCPGTSDMFYFTASSAGVDNFSTSSFLIYPNPTNSIVTISNLPLGTTIHISDFTGNIVFQKDFLEEEFVFDVSNFSNGIYVVEMAFNGSITNAKLLINK